MNFSNNFKEQAGENGEEVEVAVNRIEQHLKELHDSNPVLAFRVQVILAAMRQMYKVCPDTDSLLSMILTTLLASSDRELYNEFCRTCLPSSIGDERGDYDRMLAHTGMDTSIKRLSLISGKWIKFNTHYCYE